MGADHVEHIYLETATGDPLKPFSALFFSGVTISHFKELVALYGAFGVLYERDYPVHDPDLLQTMSIPTVDAISLEEDARYVMIFIGAPRKN